MNAVCGHDEACAAQNNPWINTKLNLKLYHLWASFTPWRCFKRPALIDKVKARVSGGNPRIDRPQPHCVRRYSGQRSAATPPSIRLSNGAKSIPNLIHF